MTLTAARHSAPAVTLFVAVMTLAQGVGTAFVGHVVQPNEATFVTLVANGFSMLIPLATVIVTKKLSTIRWEPRTVGLLLVLNVATAATFISYYVAVTLIAPSASTVLEAGVGPLALFALGLAGFAQRAPRVSVIVSVALSVVVACTVGYLLLSYSAEPVDEIVGVVLSIFAGLGSIVSTLIVRRLIHGGLTPMTVSAVRFPLAVIVSAVLCFTPQTLSEQPWLNAQIYLVAVFGVTLPIIGLQFGIRRSHPMTIALMLSCLPAIVFTTESILQGRVDAALLTLSFSIVAISVFGVFAQHAVDRRANAAPRQRLSSVGGSESAG
jgi:drug/metabolite transporter (DMT)-like permease